MKTRRDFKKFGLKEIYISKLFPEEKMLELTKMAMDLGSFHLIFIQEL
jgi:hypothetical protein